MKEVNIISIEQAALDFLLDARKKAGMTEAELGQKKAQILGQRFMPCGMPRRRQRKVCVFGWAIFAQCARLWIKTRLKNFFCSGTRLNKNDAHFSETILGRRHQPPFFFRKLFSKYVDK